MKTSLKDIAETLFISQKPKYGYIGYDRINHTGYYRLFLLQSCPFYRKGSGNTRLFINDL